MSARAEDSIKVDVEEEQLQVAGTSHQRKVDVAEDDKARVQLCQLPWGPWLFEQMGVVSRLNQMTKRRM